MIAATSSLDYQQVADEKVNEYFYVQDDKFHSNIPEKILIVMKTIQKWTELHLLPAIFS